MLIALSVPVWPGAGGAQPAPAAAGGFASGRSTDASIAAPKATVASQSGWQTRPSQILLGPQFSSLEPDRAHAARVVQAQLRAAAAHPLRSYPLLI